MIWLEVMIGDKRGEPVGHGFEIIGGKRVFRLDVEVRDNRPCRVRLVAVFDTIVLHENCNLGTVLAV